MKCPSCGKLLINPEKAQDIEVADEDLELKTEDIKREERAKRKREEAEAKTLDQLVALGKSRGYKFPTQWAQKKFGASAWRRRIATE